MTKGLDLRGKRPHDELDAKEGGASELQRGRSSSPISATSRTFIWFSL